jgi:hypothetical protein
MLLDVKRQKQVLAVWRKSLTGRGRLHFGFGKISFGASETRRRSRQLRKVRRGIIVNGQL